MDKGEQIKRGGSSRFSAAMRQIGEDSDGDLDKSSKKEKLRRLSSVDKISEMGQFSHSTKKFFDGDNQVNHASVPRKLRSAMKKRRPESVSTSFSNSRNGIGRYEIPSIDCRKKLKMNEEEQQDLEKSLKESIVEEITEEEEAVAEALFALAGILPVNDKADDIKFENGTSKHESLNLRGSFQESMTPNEAIAPELNLECNNNGLFLSTSPTGGTCAPFLQPSSAKLPSWLGNVVQPCPSKSVGVNKDSNNIVNTDGKKSWKRCSAQVYICRLIKVLQITENKESKSNRNEGSERQDHVNLTIANNPESITNLYGDKNAIFLHQKLFQEQEQANTKEAALTQFCAPYHLQNHAISSQNRYSSTFNGHEQVPIQVPPYYGSPLYDPSQWSKPVFPKQQQQQKWTSCPNGKQDDIMLPISSLFVSNEVKAQFEGFPYAYHEENGGGLYLVDSSNPLKLTLQ